MHKSTILALLLFFITPQIANACREGEYGNARLIKKKWTSVKKAMKNTSMTLEREAVTKSRISGILGSSGDCSTSGRIENCVWRDRENCKKKVIAKFRDGELSTIRKSGF